MKLAFLSTPSLISFKKNHRFHPVENKTRYVVKSVLQESRPVSADPVFSIPQYSDRLLNFSDHAIIAPFLMNPHADEVNRVTKELCEKHNIVLPKFDGYCTMTQFLFPRVPLEHAICINLWMCIMWFIDDAPETLPVNEFATTYDEFRKIADTAALIMADGYVPDHDHMVYPACREMNELVKRYAHKDWIPRFRKNAQGHLNSIVCHFETNRASTKEKSDEEVDKMTFNDWVIWRELDSGIYSSIDCIELGYGMYIPEEVLQHPVIREIKMLTIWIGSFSNDIFSYEKEVMDRGNRLNMIRFLMEKRNLSFQEGLHQAVVITNQCSERLIELERKIPNFGDKDLDRNVQKYVEGMKDQANAAYHWQFWTNRYRSPNSPFPELRNYVKMPTTSTLG